MTPAPGMDRKLFREFLRAYPFQPATALWRAVEIGELLRRALPEGRGLDLGCGDGKLTRIIMEHASRRSLVGVDLDPGETEQAARLGFYEAVHTTSAAEIPEPGESFDFVLSNSVLEHIPDLGPVLAEVSRLLKPNGRFLFTVPSAGFHRCLRGPILPWVERERYLAALDRRLAHLRYPTVAEWEGMLASSGLALEAVDCFLSRAQVRRWETISRLTGGLLYGLFMGAKQPIEIQRSLGMRGLQGRISMPAALAAAIAGVLALGLGAEAAGAPDEMACGCLLIIGRKP